VERLPRNIKNKGNRSPQNEKQKTRKQKQENKKRKQKIIKTIRKQLPRKGENN
jgi:hypothetical protein